MQKMRAIFATCVHVYGITFARRLGCWWWSPAFMYVQRTSAATNTKSSSSRAVDVRVDRYAPTDSSAFARAHTYARSQDVSKLEGLLRGAWGEEGLGETRKLLKKAIKVNTYIDVGDIYIASHPTKFNPAAAVYASSKNGCWTRTRSDAHAMFPCEREGDPPSWLQERLAATHCCGCGVRRKNSRSPSLG